MNKLSLPFSLFHGEVTLSPETQCISYFNTQVIESESPFNEPGSCNLDLRVKFSDEPISVGVNLPDMVTLIFNVSRLMSVQELQTKIEKRTGILYSTQILLSRNEPLQQFSNLMKNRIYNNSCLTLDYKTQHVITDYTEGAERRQLTIESSARQSTPAHIKAVVHEKWGYEPEEQDLTAELDEGLGMGQQKCRNLKVSRVATVNVCVSLPDGSSLNMKVNPHKRVEDLKREVIERSPSLHPQVDIEYDEHLAVQCLTHGATLQLYTPASTEAQGNRYDR